MQMLMNVNTGKLLLLLCPPMARAQLTSEAHTKEPQSQHWYRLPAGLQPPALSKPSPSSRTSSILCLSPYGVLRDPKLM